MIRFRIFTQFSTSGWRGWREIPYFHSKSVTTLLSLDAEKNEEQIKWISAVWEDFDLNSWYENIFSGVGRLKVKSATLDSPGEKNAEEIA